MNIMMLEQAASFAPSAKRLSDEDVEDGHTAKRHRMSENGQPLETETCEGAGEDLFRPFPYFFYKDYSTHPDPDSLTPLTAPGRVPNFPAKMHAILSRPDLADVICWMPHGRSWKVLKPRDFEIRILPAYFEHCKFSSFVRQANGWGFRRITEGRDRNSYYHPMFLRGLPHLCKQMKRPGVAQKAPADPEHEPDLYKISEFHPVPQKAHDDSIRLHSTLQGGPKARMSIQSILAQPASLTPRDHEALSSFQKSLGASDVQMMNISESAATPRASNFVVPQGAFSAPLMSSNQALAAANQLAFANHPSPFAAGFVAAAALNEQQLYSMLVAQQYNGAINNTYQFK
jgi:HSF-type DNA-binding